MARGEIKTDGMHSGSKVQGAQGGGQQAEGLRMPGRHPGPSKRPLDDEDTAHMAKRVKDAKEVHSHPSSKDAQQRRQELASHHSPVANEEGASRTPAKR